MEYYNHVYIKIKRMSYSKVNDDITSCVQETFIKAWINIERLQNHENVAGWLIICAAGVVGNFNKKYNIRKKADIDTLEIEDITDEKDFAQDIVETEEFPKIQKILFINKKISFLFFFRHFSFFSNYI